MIKKLLFLFHRLRIYSFTSCYTIIGFPRCYNSKEPAYQCKRCERCGFDPWFRKIPWRMKWQPTPVFLPGKSHGQRGLAGNSPWGHRVRHDWVTKPPPTPTPTLQACVCHVAVPVKSHLSSGPACRLPPTGHVPGSPHMISAHRGLDAHSVLMSVYLLRYT